MNKVKVENLQGEVCILDKDKIVTKLYLPARKFVNGKYVPQYRLVTVNNEVFHVDCDKFDKGLW